MTAYVFKRKRPPVLQYTNDYTKTGSFGQINKGVASGFTTGNYLKAPANFSPSSNTWEWNFKFNIVTDVSTTQYILGCTNTSGSHGAMLGIVSGKFTCWLSANGTSWNIVTDGTIKTSLVAGETYYVKFGWTGSEYYIDLSTNGIDYVREYTLASTTAVHSSAFNIGTAWQLSYPFKGSIDLSQSYININGERWWSGDSYTKVGSWIEDNVVSGFSASNYLQIPETVPLATANTWEKVVKFTYQTGDQSFISSNNSAAKEDRLGVNAGGVPTFLVGANTSSHLFEITGTTTLTVGNTYWIKGEFTGSEYNLYLSTNGVDYTLEASASSTTKCLSRVNYIGTTTIKNYEYVSQSPIDLTESYIKIDGEYWWQGAKYVNDDRLYVFKRKEYWKYEYKDWTQPVLTANGTMGGSSFAASQVGFADEGDLKAFRAFDNNTSTMCYFAKSTGYLQWYNPNPLKITNLKLTNYIGDSWGTRALTSGSIQVSNNGSDFVELKTFTNSATGGGASWNIDLSANTGYYKYYRIVCTGNSVARPEANAQCHIAELKITATEQYSVPSTKDDYDFTTDRAYVLRRK